MKAAEEIKKAIERTNARIEAKKDEYFEELYMDPDDIEDEFQDMDSWKKDLQKIQREVARLEGMIEGYELALGMVQNED